MRSTSFCSLRTAVCPHPLLGGLAALISVLLLVGCVVIPVDEEAPFDSLAQTFEIGQTTRKDVLYALGQPQIVRRDEMLFVYAGHQIQAVMLYFAASSGGAAGGGLGFGKTHVLAVSFDPQGVLENMELSEERTIASEQGTAPTEHCIATGECFVTGQVGLVAFATEAEDKAAKTFAATPGSCNLYLYPDGPFDYAVILDRRERLASNTLGYFLWQLEPGSHHIAALERLGQPTVSLDLHCISGEILYVRCAGSRVFQGMRLDITAAEEAQSEIRLGKLVLDNL